MGQTEFYLASIILCALLGALVGLFAGAQGWPLSLAFAVAGSLGLIVSIILGLHL